MNILISNDDGYLAPGIQELARRIRRFGNVTVVAVSYTHLDVYKRQISRSPDVRSATAVFIRS